MAGDHSVSLAFRPPAPLQFPYDYRMIIAMKASDRKSQPKPVLLLRFTVDGKTYEAEVPGGIVAMKGKGK
jgi:hypothetical protein